MAVIPAAAAEEAKIEAELAAGAMPGGRLDASVRDALLRGPGALPGSAEWTHQYGSVTGTGCSEDQRVRMPFEVLWFGKPGPGKSSKAGRLDLIHRDGAFEPVALAAGAIEHEQSMMRTVVENGEILVHHRFDECRERMAICTHHS